MFRVIHPNRWYFWALALLLAFALVLLYLVVQSNLQIEEDIGDLTMSPGQNLSDSSYQGWKVYRSEDLGFSVKYPPQWQLEVEPTVEDVVNLENPKNFSENITISVVSPELQSVIRSTISAANQKSVEIDGQTAEWLINVDEDDVAARNIVFAEYENRLYYIAGNAQQFEKIITSIIFIEDSQK